LRIGAEITGVVLGARGLERAETLSIIESRSILGLWAYIKFERLVRYYNDRQDIKYENSSHPKEKSFTLLSKLAL
jgi:hypothetical protein